MAWLLALIIGVVYFLSHLWQLDALPVFADEAIYIRWAQLIIDSPKYLFFSLNDGKTPLFFWLLLPFQYWQVDQLWSARLLAVLIGAFEIPAIYLLVKNLGLKREAKWLAAIFTVVLPYWFFHHRMALTDGLLAVWLTLFLGQIFAQVQIINAKKFEWPKLVLPTGLAGLSLGLAFWTKLPAVLILPTLIVPLVLLNQLNFDSAKKYVLASSISSIIGLAIFGLLKLNPAFGQLFSRGGDFLYPVSDFLAGAWQHSLTRSFSYLFAIANYLTWPVILMTVVGLFTANRKKIGALMLMGMIFVLPMMLLGKTVYPRYFLPLAIFVTSSAAIAIEGLIDDHFRGKKERSFLVKLALSLFLGLAMANTASSSLNWMVTSWTNPAKIPFSLADQVQYLTEWSAGYGTKEVAAMINQEAKSHSVAVATEGYFGSLPDGLVLYFHRRPTDNIFIDGIGQPVAQIPQVFLDKTTQFEKKWLVVNSHRLRMNIPANKLLAEFCRPNNSPCLQVYDITELVASKSAQLTQ